MHTATAVAALALLPGVLAWRWHRRLRQSADPALLPERTASVNRRLSAVMSGCAMLVVLGGGSHAAWALPLLLVAVAAAAYPTRRLLFGETWPFHRYLEWRARVVCGVAGFFVLLAAAPALLHTAPPGARGGTAAVLLAGLLGWHHWHARILLLSVRASPLQRPDLDRVFAPVLRRTTALAPTLWRAGPDGGVVANALAVPGLRGGRVVFFDTLLDRLTPPEVAAILAHEVAHLEYFEPRRVRRGYAAALVAIVLALGAGLITADGTGQLAFWIPRVWPALVFVALAARAGHMQANETASDARACDLCGDPDALVSALTRLHAIHHIPRRCSASVEEYASHPSLARRIRAIHAAARRGAVRRVDEPLLVPSRETGRFALFDHERLAFVWARQGGQASGDPVADAARLEATDYAGLVELHVATRRDGPLLVARAAHGGAWTMALHAADVARVQTVLDIVDQLLAPKLPARRIGGRRVAAALAIAAAGVLSSLVTIIVPALLALLRPTRPALAGLAAALAAAGLVVDSGSLLGSIRALVFALLAGAALWQARAQAPNQDVQIPRMPSWAEGLWLALPLAAGAIWILGANRHDLFGLHTTARDAAWLAASAAALTGYLAVSTVRRHRRLSVGAAALAVAVLWFGSSSFLTAVVRDPLAVDMPFLEARSEPLTPVAQTSVSGRFARIRLTRDGRHFLLSQYDAEDYPEDEGPQRHVVGAFDGWSRAIESAEAAFIDDERLLIADRDAGATRLRAEPVREAAASWTMSLPGVDAISMRTGPEGRWQVVHRGREGFARIAGRVGTASVERTDEHVDSAPGEYVTQYVDDGGGNALAVTSDWRGPLLPWLASGWRTRTSLLHVGRGRTSRLATSDLTVRCAEPSIGAGRAVCVAFDGRLSRFWEYDPERRAFQARGQTRGMVFSLGHVSGRMFAAAVRSGVALVDLDAAEIVILGGARASLGLDLATSAGLVASATIEGNRTAVTLHHAAGLLSTP